MVDPLRAAFDAEGFRAMGYRAVDALADYLAQALPGEDLGIFHGMSADELDAHWPGTIAAQGAGDPAALIADLIPLAHHLHHPGYVGHQVATPLPAAALAEMTSALLNNGMAIYEMGPINVVCERRVIAFLCEQIGWGPQSDGVLTHGGSVGNLTALLAARQAKAGFDVWQAGQSEPFCLLASAQNHYCVARAVRLMGWGADGIELVEVDEHYRLRPDRLQAALERAQAKGRQVLGVVASDCTTATGSFDPIDPIADFCEAHDLWLHVDGAHGASFLLHPEARHKLAGIARADSVVWDLHKMMLVPALATAVVFREGRRSYEAFAQEASYLFGGEDPEVQWYNLGQRTLECTKRGIGATAYTMLRAYGVDFFREYLDRMLRLTADFAAAVQTSDDFELAVVPEANIVCFRYRFAGRREQQNGLQSSLRSALIQSGDFYLVQTQLDGVLWLRMTLIHPLTDLARLQRLLAEARRLARALAEVR